MVRPNHQKFDELLAKMEKESKVSRNVLARVLVRLMISAPRDVARADIAMGKMLAKPSMLNQSAVSRAVACLIDHGLVTQFDQRVDDNRSGRPIMPLRLGSTQWALMGIKVIHEKGRPIKLYGVVTDMRVDRGLKCLAELEKELPADLTFQTVAGPIQDLHDELLRQLPQQRQLFGVGVEVAAHVHNGLVIGATHVGLMTDEEYDLLAELQRRLHVPVVIDNDVNLLAVRQTYKPAAERHVAVVAVFYDGVGASLIIDGHVYRGGGGMAAEPGHLIVADLPVIPPPTGQHTPGTERGFSDPCHCGVESHVDCYAVPRRLATELGAPLNDAGRTYARDATGLTREATVFRAGGEALGQGIASIVNVVNPSRVLLILPADLALADTLTEDISATKEPDEILGRAQPGTAAAEYLEGVEDALTKYCFSRGAADARAGRRRLTVQILEPAAAEKEGAVCAAIRVMDSFVMHARERDRCYDLAADGTTTTAENA